LGLIRAWRGLPRALSLDEMTSVPLVPRTDSNQLVYREVNERIHSIGAELFQLRGDQQIEIVCECLSTTCCERIQIAVAAFEELRGQASRFAVLPGHEQLDLQRVVELHPAYVVVEKDATAVAVSGYPADQGVSL
jgi:hypothetical protein